MKFCPKKRHEYKGLNCALTTIDYTTFDSVEAFHGEKFAKKWLEFVKYKSKFFIDGQECYYYYDYEFAARQTHSFLHPDN